MSGKARVAVVDDESALLRAWRRALADRFEVATFSDPVVADQSLSADPVDVVVLDVKMPAMDGLSLLRRLRAAQPMTEAIVVTGHGTIETAVEAIKLGAFDFLTKPIESFDLAIHRIESALERKRLRELNAGLRARLEAHAQETELIGESPAMRKVRALLGQLADSPAPVLVCGESGTGKELVARALHRRGTRRDRPFVAVNCAAIRETLVDSELFGHERGAFTGAVARHQGLFEAADGGVLFLDEIGDVPLPTQVYLLRALQEGEIRPVGSTRSRKVDVRVIAATNVDLDRAMKQGRFREDLFYRISTFRIELPPLRERREDIPLLLQHLLDKFGRRTGRAIAGFSDEALEILLRYDWPGNVRELANVVEYAATLGVGERIDAAFLPAHVLARPSPSRGAAGVPSVSASGEPLSALPYAEAKARWLEDFQSRYLSELLDRAGGNLSEAARLSGLDRANLRRMLRKLGQ